MEKIVSIIIPAFNVENYIDKCIQSIVYQSYKNIEIIIVNDGSIDKTGEKCKKWAEIDNRIIYFFKPNEGQGVARNYGIEKAHGQYLIFVDADDWIGERYIEKLLYAIDSRGDDIVICDFIRVEQTSGKKERISQNFNNCNRNDIAKFVEPSLCGKIFKKDIFISKSIKQPSHYFEDVAIVPFLILTASSISYVEGIYYFYLRRNISTSNSLISLEDRAYALSDLVNLFKESDLFDKFKNQLVNFILFRSKVDLLKTKKLFKEKYIYILEQHSELIKRDFDIQFIDEYEKDVAVWGSYNLYRIAKIMIGSDIKLRFTASSIISATSAIIPEINALPLKCSTNFRQENVINDCTKRFMNMNPSEFSNTKYLLIDFLEERFTVGYYGNNCITISDDYKESNSIKLEFNYLNDDEKQEQWKKSCKQFISRIKCYFSVYNIILIRMKLTEYYGEYGKEILFTNVEEIRKINKTLDLYYDFFVSECPGIIDIEVDKIDYYYTDINFKHGCFPWHLNNQAYYKIFENVRRKIEELHG